MLLMFLMRIVLATVSFVTDLEAEVWSESLTFVQTLNTLVKILRLNLAEILMFG